MCWGHCVETESVEISSLQQQYIDLLCEKIYELKFLFWLFDSSKHSISFLTLLLFNRYNATVWNYVSR